MTQKTALEVKDLAFPCFNAIKTIAGERECGECDGTGLIHRDHTRPHCVYCNGTGKVGYIWKPQESQTILCRKEIHTISLVGKHFLYYLIPDQPLPRPTAIKPENCIPILDWEEIEKILEEVGYLLRLRGTPSGWIPVQKWYCDVIILHRDAAQVRELNSLAVAKSRQQAVMLAVIALAKEMSA